MQFATTDTLDRSSPFKPDSRSKSSIEEGFNTIQRNGSLPAGASFAAQIKTAPWNKEERKTLTPGTRRLRNIGRDEQRPVECRLRSLRHVQQKTDAEASAILNLHIDDLDDLAATHGQP
jgi:hypothetical protein